MREASDIVFQNHKTKNSHIKPGWNDYVTEIYQASKDARSVWLDHNKPRQGPIFDTYTRLRAKCKYAIRYIKTNENNLEEKA